ncbi:hypothetical protein [Candidatus Uabimicrobium sp. HlEnr_7]|uniref:hypothetical protein n=1 Tax=Candidatus Uabimicrobium helgolandensis TaxID=3095367 RepID=UPI0035576FC8
MYKLSIFLCLIFSIYVNADKVWKNGAQLEKEDKWQEAGDLYFSIAQQLQDKDIKLQAFLKAAKSYYKANDKIQIAASYIGAVSCDNENHDKYWHEIWHIGEELEHKRNWILAAKYYTSFAQHTRKAQIRTAFCYKQVGEYVKAANCYREILNSWNREEQVLYEKWGIEAANYYEKGKEWLALGSICETLHKHTQKIKYVIQAAEAFSRSKDTFDKSSTTYKIASEIEKDERKSQKLFEKHLFYKLKDANNLYEKGNISSKLQAAQQYIAYADSIAAQDYYKASEMYWKVLDLYKELNKKNYYSIVHFKIGLLEEKHNNLSQGYRQIYKAIRLEEKTAKDFTLLASSISQLELYFSKLLQIASQMQKSQSAIQKQQQVVERLQKHYKQQNNSKALGILDSFNVKMQK